MEKEGWFVTIIHWLTRYGCVCIGLVYGMVGVIAILSLLSLKDGGADEDSLLEFLMDFTVGQILIWIILGGILGYIIWRIYEAIMDPYHYGKSFTGITQRTGIALSALAYGVIALSGIQALLGIQTKGDGAEEQQVLVAKVFELPGGAWIIGLLGVITGVAAMMEIKYMICQDYEVRIVTRKISKNWEKVIDVFAWAGQIARAIILFIVAYFLIKSAIELNPSEVGDMDTAFNFIGEVLFGKTIGHPLFVLVALGTISYGIFMILLGVFYKFQKGANG